MKYKVSFKNVEDFFANLLDPVYFKKNFQNSEIKEVADLYQDTIYNFTKIKNQKLFSSQIFYMVFDIFVQRGDLEEFLTIAYKNENDRI